MYKGFKISVTLILMLACVSLGEIQQGQGFGIGGQNSVALIDGPGVADSTNLTTASQGQGASAMGGLIMAEEFQNGVGIGLQAFLGAQYQVIASPFGISMNVNIPAASTLQVAHY
jgi:hypothetical protein